MKTSKNEEKNKDKSISNTIKTVTELTDAINSIDSKNVNVFAMPKRLKTQDFVILFHDKILELLDPNKNKTFKPTATEIRILIQYAKRMKYGNQISISQIDIAEELGLDTAVVSRCIKKLLQAGVFYKDGRSMYMSWEYIAKGNLNDFILNNKKQKKLSLEKQIKQKERELLELKMQKDKEDGGDGVPF